MILDGQVYLEHYGKKGMKWGKRSTKQKLAIAGVGAVSGIVISRFISGRTLNTKMSLIGGTASALAGAKATANFLDQRGNTSMSNLQKRS